MRASLGKSCKATMLAVTLVKGVPAEREQPTEDFLARVEDRYSMCCRGPGLLRKLER